MISVQTNDEDMLLQINVDECGKLENTVLENLISNFDWKDFQNTHVRVDQTNDRYRSLDENVRGRCNVQFGDGTSCRKGIIVFHEMFQQYGVLVESTRSSVNGLTWRVHFIDLLQSVTVRHSISNHCYYQNKTILWKKPAEISSNDVIGASVIGVNVGVLTGLDDSLVTGEAGEDDDEDMEGLVDDCVKRLPVVKSPSYVPTKKDKLSAVKSYFLALATVALYDSQCNFATASTCVCINDSNNDINTNKRSKYIFIYFQALVVVLWPVHLWHTATAPMIASIPVMCDQLLAKCPVILVEFRSIDMQLITEREITLKFTCETTFTVFYNTRH